MEGEGCKLNEDRREVEDAGLRRGVEREPMDVEWLGGELEGEWSDVDCAKAMRRWARR